VATEVHFPRRGELRTRDARAVYGSEFKTMPYVDVLVLDAGHGAPVAGRIELSYTPSGLSMRRAFVCPTCRSCKHLLLARHGRLACAGCHRAHLTRRQREHRNSSWTEFGGRREDALLRLLRPTVVRTKARLTDARRLVWDILALDRARVGELRQQLADLEVCVRAAR
jgi:hypothetical protein